MKIVVLDARAMDPGDLSWDRLRKLGELTIYDRTPPELVIERIGDADAVYTNKVPITREILENCPNMKWVGVFATGYNIIDVEACREFGVVVTNVPDYSTQAVAQHVFALLLEITTRVGEHNDAVQQGEWVKSADFSFRTNRLIELYSKKIGIIGFGNTGKATAKIAQAFGMQVLVYTRTIRPEYEAENLKFVSFEELLRESDIISLNCPLFDSTRNLICKESIAKMKDGVILINTARGPILHEEDVMEALNSGKIYALGADVVSVEPMLPDNPLLKAKNAIITPHIAWAPKETRERLMRVSVDNLESFLRGCPENVVN